MQQEQHIMTDKKSTPPSILNTSKTENKPSDEQREAELAVGGVINSLQVVNYASRDLCPINAAKCFVAMEQQAKAVHQGNMQHVETMLISQAIALDSLFASMALRAQERMGKDQLHVMQAYMKLGLKAQSQCRTTLETLANIKNPRPYIQNNKAQYQQVNNGAAVEGQGKTDQYAQAHTRTHAGENQKSSNELLKHPPVGVLQNKVLSSQPENLIKPNIQALEAQHYETLD
jgi:hypothetical protein